MKYDIVLNGFRFKVIAEDYDYMYAKSVRYKYNKKNMQRALDFKFHNEQDFVYREYDCTGSTRVRIDIHVKKKRYIVINYKCNKDV